MEEVLTIPENTTQWPEPPRLLVEWSSPWEEFKTAFRPALTRAPKALAGEAPVGIFPYRGILVAWVLECLLLIAVIVLPDRLASFQPVPPPQHPKWDVIYYSGDELPQTADRGGAQSGKSGHAGGEQAHHRTQTIRVARGDKPGEQIVDAPNVKLPHSDSAVANLLALKPSPGPPPAEGLRSSLVAPALPTQSPVPPSPELQSSSGRTNPHLATNVIPPAPEIAHTNSRSAPALNSAPIAPAPDVARDKMRSANPLAANVVAPAPNISRDKMRAANPLANNVVAPAPSDAQRDLASSRAPVSQTTNVVAPPVSAPARDSASAAKLSLPAPAVIAPPPSQVSRDLNSWGSTHSGDIHSQPVPPPPSAAGGSLTRSGAGTLAAQVVPPPASMEGLSGASGSGSAGGSQSNGRGASQLGPATVVPPPPGIGGGKALGGSGRGNKGLGTGSPLDIGTTAAPPSNAGGNTAGTGVVMSSQPGTKVGLPNSTGGGAIAMSPTGTAKTGLGGSGGGNGIGRGNGPGSGLQGEGSGAGKEGAGRGSDPNARGGISPYPGQGGAGTGTTSVPAMPGVSVQGGTTTVTLPSFGGASGSAPATGPGRSTADKHTGSGITIEATPRSGGVFAYYGVLKGDRNYSIYIETSLGTAVMQYADPASAAHSSKEALTAPEPMHKELPSGLRPTRVILACILDRSGLVKNVRVLEPGAAETTTKILAALQSWKFRPAFRGNEPVEVNAILGFGVDTR
jgi:hypothetical protein